MAERSDAILVVEDNPDDLALLLRAFRKVEVGVPVRTAETGQAALDYLEAYGAGRSEDRLLAILLDLKLPIVSGFEVLEWLKSHPRLKAVPVVILTSSDESQDVKRGYDLGANSYLVKPADPVDLMNMVATIRSYWIDLNVPR